MRMICLAVLMWCVAGCVTAQDVPERMNVLLICVDDLRPELGCVGGFAATPRLDALAAGGVVYTRHYAVVPTCGASRAAMLTGLMPTNGRQRGNGAMADWMRRDVPPVTLPGAFRAAGWRTVMLGKISHSASGWTSAAGGVAEVPGAWDRIATDPGAWRDGTALLHAYPNGVHRVPGESPLTDFSAERDEDLPDGVLAARASEELLALAGARRADEDGGGQPWFLAVGFYKPHLPFCAPASYWEEAGARALPDAPWPVRPAGAVTWRQSGEVTGNYDAGGRWADRQWDAAERVELRRAYAACVAYVDAQIGRVLEALEASGEAERTVVVVWGDHGWHLGDAGLMGKHTLMEEALRSALVVRVPGGVEPGRVSERLVSSADLMPTLGALCGVAMPDGLSVGFADDLVAGMPGAARESVPAWWGDAVSVRTATHRLVRRGERSVLYAYGAGVPWTRDGVEDVANATRAALEALLPGAAAQDAQPVERE